MPPTQQEAYMELTNPDDLTRDLLLTMRSRMILLQRQQKIRLLKKKEILLREQLTTHISRAQGLITNVKNALPAPPPKPKKTPSKEETASPMDELESLIKQIDEKIQRLSQEKE